MTDTPVWGLNSSGTFTVKSATWLAHGINPDKSTWKGKWIWKVDVPPKIQIFLWQVIHNSLSVRNTLFKRHIIPFNTCALCDTRIETIDHLFLSCPKTKELWTLSLTKHWLDAPVSVTSIEEAFKNYQTHKTALRKFIFLIWSLWKERNATIFRNEKFDVFRIYHRARHTFMEWDYRTRIDSFLSLGEPIRQPRSHPPSNHHLISVAWEAPPPNFFKLNFDGSVRHNSAAAGVIIRNSNGQPHKACAYNLGSTSSFVAEATALHLGIVLARDMGISNLHIEGDNLLVINAVLGTWSSP